MAEKVLMIGQFPPPVTGEGKMNLQVQGMLQQAGFEVSILNSCIVDSVNDVGQVNIVKLLRMFKLLWQGLWLQMGVGILYMTPGQTLMGLLRFLPLLLAARLSRKKIILHWHGYGVLSACLKYPRLARCYLSAAVLNIVLTEDLRLKLQQLGFAVERVKVLGNFSELPAVMPVPRADSQKLKVVFLGGLMPEKGVDTFLQLAAKTQQFEFVLCGAGNEFITASAKALAQRGLLTFPGLIDGEEKQQLLKDADIFVLQTHHPTEGVPLTILEAMSCGCAIVTTRHNGIPETVGDAALFIEAKSVDSLLAGLQLLDADRNQLRLLKHKAFERSQNFSAASFREELVRLFRI
ncbi:glycosyltransferase family 4 protein [Rheinheimera texasensis]|uniref:glycosyltransferase family 4 protein n=1 Tax=Rheinheimera texasensis TaxID=306205 RepID=UPI0004E287CA|nr:glycosyltransferase family 4 protein [Rheinheimera texasensis]